MSELVKMLSLETGLSESLVREIANSAPIRYKNYLIPKRSGGYRLISQPAREVKLLQRALMQTFLKNLDIHECATAYREGMSIYDNAQPHKGNGPILKLDFKDFFPSIKKKDWVQYCEKLQCFYDHHDIDLSASILFHKPKGKSGLQLAIGAPSSPMLSNILMFEFDQKIFEVMSVNKIKYTRYADDMTFSAPRAGYMNNTINVVMGVIKSISSPKLLINHDKTKFITSKYRRNVTGLVLTNDGRVTIGREKKRLIRAAVHRAIMKEISVEDLKILCGMLAFVNAVEPEYIDSLRDKYGTDYISYIRNVYKMHR